jgi:hypothetical protein
MERSLQIAVPEVVLVETVSVVTDDWRAERQQLMARPTSSGAPAAQPGGRPLV